MPGGRIDVGEAAEEAFRREIKEEAGLDSFRDLGIADYFIEHEENNRYHPYCGFIRLLEIGYEEIKMSFEHLEMKWISENEVDDYVYCWKKMPEMIKRGFEIYKNIKYI